MILKDNDISMYSKYNEGNSIAAERFIRTLKHTIYKHMTAISKNVYFDVLDDIVDEYNNTYHKTIKMKQMQMLKLILLLNTMELHSMKNLMKKIMSEFQSLKMYLLKDIHLTGVKKFLFLRK